MHIKFPFFTLVQTCYALSLLLWLFCIVLPEPKALNLIHNVIKYSCD